MKSLNNLKKGSICKIVAISCKEDITKRLMEMGFLIHEKVLVKANTGKNGSLLLKIKGSTIALSNKIAENIYVEEVEETK